MIFVTVGTHEQPFDRLLREVDKIAVKDPELAFFCQTGFATVAPRVPHTAALSFDQMKQRMESASIVVTHGGPGSILPLLAAEKPAVLVPRLKRHGEHVDDHQLAFCTRIGDLYGLPVVVEIDDLASALSEARPPVRRNVTGGGHAVAKLQDLITAELARRSHRQIRRGVRSAQ